MKHVYTTVFCVAAVLAGGATVQAVDSGFSGVYVGFETGYGSVKFNTKDPGTFSFGGILGYRYQLGNGLVLGAEAAYASISFDAWGGYDYSTVDLKNSWSGSGLVGYAFGGESENLIYGKVGYNHIRFDLISTGDINSPAGQVTKRSDGGMRYGVGYERKLFDMVSVRIGGEYAKQKSYYKQLEGKIAFIVNF